MVGGDWLYRREYRTVAEELEAVAAVTADEVRAVLERYPLANGTTVMIGPLAEVAAPG
jgi:predicted Zn-dependent peptidase